MEFDVKIAARAMRDAEAYREFILGNSNDDVAANQWWRGLFEALQSLRKLPARCSVIAEHRDFESPLHQLLYESHRIIFEISGRTVTVVRVSIPFGSSPTGPGA